MAQVKKLYSNMSSKTKQRQLFEISGFRGLDKENRPSKVEIFRATDGYNFEINGDTLKTRPAFKMQYEFPIFLETDDEVIAWHEYKSVTIYVTNNHIYIYDGTDCINETDSSLIKSSFSTFDFSGKTPLFVEEKDALFIFCVNNVFVFSIILDSDDDTYAYALYDLRYKPSNPYAITDFYYEQYDNLPKPYEPTIMIGNKTFEDVNLLSNVMKYKVFSSSDGNSDSKTTYMLATHYDEEKHGDYSYSVEFYDGIFDDYDIFPVFMGVEDEHFDEALSTFGSDLNSTNAVDIEDTYYPKKSFEFIGTPTSYSRVSKVVGITKEEFFNLRISTDGKTVFEYLMDYIQANHSTLTGANNYITFTLPVEYEAIYRDSTNDYITTIQRQREDFNIYVQLRYYEPVEVAFEDQEITVSDKKTHYVGVTTPDSYPDYPADPATVDYNYSLNSGNAILAPGYDEDMFRQMCLSFLEAYKATYISTGVTGEVIRIRGQFYEEGENVADAYADLPDEGDWFPGDTIDTSITWGNASTIDVAYPTGFPNPDGDEVVEFPLATTSGYFDNLEAVFASVILNNLDLMTADSGKGFAQIKVQTKWLSAGSYVTAGTAYVVPFTFAKAVSEEYEIRQSMIFVCSLNVDNIKSADDLYTFEYDTLNKAFKLKIKDYFFNYNNEPSIEVRVLFEKNPDYDLIKKMQFGVSFGAENRLFLAGNPDYPNIDRYNVSNNLLGDNVVNQSYELTYFPSKNFRVLGGRGSINGYVVATDSLLYITKAEYRNDSKLFVRQRNIDNNGVVSYHEYKTSINITPLNHRCLVRFNNDILMLCKEGIYAIEISSNVLTDERLSRMRSGLINSEIVTLIKTIDTDDAFILENNKKMYVFIGTAIYVADSRYMTSTSDAWQDYYYEIVKWIAPIAFKAGQIEDEELVLLGSNGEFFYKLTEDEGVDDNMIRAEGAISVIEVDSSGGQNAFLLDGTTYDYILDSPGDYAIRLYSGYKVIGKETTDYTYDETGTNGVVTIVNENAFRNISDGDKLYFKDALDAFHEITVSGYSDSGYVSFTYDKSVSGVRGVIYKDIAGLDLYIDQIFEYEGSTYFRASLFKPTTVETIEQADGESSEDYETRLFGLLDDNNDYFFESSGMKDLIINSLEDVQFAWFSAITAFGNELMEKTMFKTYLYFSKQQQSNSLNFGYKTMRRLSAIEDSESISVQSNENIDLSGYYNFGDIDFQLYSFSTFTDIGMSFPTKENNFLYIQFGFYGTGVIEMIGMKILYKNNRLLKSIA